jgi:hypothetical protein
VTVFVHDYGNNAELYLLIQHSDEVCVMKCIVSSLPLISRLTVRNPQTKEFPHCINQRFVSMRKFCRSLKGRIKAKVRPDLRSKVI